MAKTQRHPIGRRSANSGRGTFAWTTFVMLALASVGVAHTWTRVAVIERKYQLARDRSEHERLVEQYDKLKLEAATWESEAKVEDAAHGVLKMAKPPPTDVVVVEPTRLAHSIVPAQPVATLATNER